MKKINYNLALLFMIACLNMGESYAQQAQIQNRNIKQFIQVWGLVKYKSQKSAVGKFDADQVFLSRIDSVKNVDQNQLNQLLLGMIGSNEAIDATVSGTDHLPPLNDNQYLLKNVDYKWINDKKFGVELRKKLKNLSRQLNLTGQHHYVPTVWHESELPNEALYENYSFDSEGMNLLALAKAWAAIEYLFPYKYVMDEDWEKVLMEMIPVFRKITDRTSYEKSVLILAAAIDDTHAGELLDVGKLKMTTSIFNVRYNPPFDYVAERSGIIIKRFLNDSLAAASKLRGGDQIIAIDGTKIEKWLEERAALLPASNSAVKYRELSTSGNNRGDTFAFSNLKSGTLRVKVKRGKAYFELDLTMLDRGKKDDVLVIQNFIVQNRVQEQQIKGREDIGDDIMIFRAGHFFDKDMPAEQDVAQLSAELKSKKALIFDMRKYPQSPGLFSYYLPLMLGKAPFAFARYYAVNLSNIGTFKLREGVENYMYAAKDAPKPMGELYQGKIVILTNADTQSMGEWFSMMLRQFNSNTTVIGCQTAGADGDLKRIALPGGYRFSFTGNGIFYPDGKETQRTGIVPDVYFKPSAEDWGRGGDAQLLRAIKYVREGK